MNGNYSRSISRRHFLATASFASTAVLLNSEALFGADDKIVQTIFTSAAKAKIVVTPLRNQISVLSGSGGNVAVLAGRDGKLLVDAGIAASRSGIAGALASIGPDPLKQLINTHWHFDHTDGNEWLHSTGALIFAHENTRKRLSTNALVPDWNYTFPALVESALPGTVFKQDLTLYWNSQRLDLEHYAPAHTDTDISVHFADANVIHVGDTWWNGLYPFIDYSTGGSINGTIAAAEWNLNKVDAGTIIIPGHGSTGGKSQLLEFRDMLLTVRDKVASLKKEGRSIDDVVAAKPTAAFDAKWGGSLISPSHFTKLVYVGVQ